MSATSSRSVSRSGTPLGTRPHSPAVTTTTTTATTSSSSLSDPTSNNQNNSNYFSYPVSRVVTGLYRRLTDPPQKTSNNNTNTNNRNVNNSNMNPTNSSSSLYTPKRTASPFQPPPLTPLTLKSSNAPGLHLHPHILSRALAEEIRLLVPPRLQLVDTWRLAYSLERDGASLGTLYDHCRHVADRNPRAGYVLVVRDTTDGGAVFGAYLTDAPHPASHFYGTGECFLWRASVLGGRQGIWNDYYKNGHNNNSNNNNNHEKGHDGHDDATESGHTMTDEELRRAGLPPPPSADTTHAVRSTTLRASTPTSATQRKTPTTTTTSNSSNNLLSIPPNVTNGSGTSTPERIRFKAFPYSGINDYMIFCETGFLSVGGGDGHYGLWIDDSVEKGVSDSCPTFGNEPLSDEGTKFDILGLEIWYIGT